LLATWQQATPSLGRYGHLSGCAATTQQQSVIASYWLPVAAAILRAARGLKSLEGRFRKRQDVGPQQALAHAAQSAASAHAAPRGSGILPISAKSGRPYA
jgi:hypothetical protein